MDNVRRTLYIPLYGKACVSRKGILLRDPKAEEIWEKAGFALKGKPASKWLAYWMAMRAAVFDQWTLQQMERDPEAIILHIGCGMDARGERLDHSGHPWYDLDFPEVIRERRKYFAEGEDCRMVCADLRREDWKDAIPSGGKVIAVMEGVSMYLRPEELTALLRGLRGHFSQITLLMDCYSTFAARASRYKNPINAVGVRDVWGVDDPAVLADRTGLAYVKEHSMTPTRLIRELAPGERIVFSNLYAGRLARKLYRLFEFKA